MNFTWTYSKLNAFETCPKRHYEVDIAKNYQDGDGENLKWGNYVHEKLAKSCTGDQTLPAELAPYQKWVDRARRWGAGVTTEHRAAFTKDFVACNYSAPTVWWRGRIDLTYIDNDLAVSLDWKTGKIIDDSVQLGITAQWIFSSYPNVQKVITEYVWLKEDCTTSEVFERQDMKYLWSQLIPRVEAYEQTLQKQEFKPKPGGLCVRYCPVTSCPFHGKGTRG